MKENDFVKYIGPTNDKIEYGEELRIVFKRVGGFHCSNMNMPFTGSFVGFLPTKYLKKL